MGAELAGIGGTVRSIRPIVQYKKFIPVQNRRNALGFNVQGSFITGYAGLVAPPFQRSYMGGENDLRGFDIRSVSPVAFLPSVGSITLTNPDGTPVLKNPQNPSSGNLTIPIPVDQITFPGGDLSIVTNFEYRITIYGPVALAPFMDAGIDPILRPSQLQIASQQYDQVVSAAVWMSCTRIGDSDRNRYWLHSGQRFETTAVGSVAGSGIDQLETENVHWSRAADVPAQSSMRPSAFTGPTIRCGWIIPATPPIPITPVHVPAHLRANWLLPDLRRAIYLSLGGKHLRAELPVTRAAQDVPLHGGDDVLEAWSLVCSLTAARTKAIYNCFDPHHCRKMTRGGRHVRNPGV